MCVCHTFEQHFFFSLKNEIKPGQNLKSILSEPILLKDHPDFGKICELDCGYDIKTNFRPIVVSRFFNRHEIELYSFTEWDRIGTAFVKFIKCHGEPDTQLHMEIGKNCFATKKEITDRKKTPRSVLALSRNGKSYNLYRETVEKMCDSVYDSLTPKIHRLFSTRGEESRKKVCKRLFPEEAADTKENEKENRIDTLDVVN